MGRFLIFFSYIGTRYCGVQQQANAFSKGKPLLTAGGVLQDVIQYLQPANESRIVLSSRTDKGVHALKNACHVDLQHPEEGCEFHPAVVTHVLNYHLRKRQEDVRVIETRRVRDDFHSRHFAVGRKYVYRLGHTVKPSASYSLSGNDQSREAFLAELRKYSPRVKGHSRLPIGDPVPTLDASKILICRDQLDVAKMAKAASLISGVHDFTSLSSRHSLKSQSYFPHPVKLVNVGMKRGQPLGGHMVGLGSGLMEHVEFWDIHVQAKSFLYKMVRRIVGSMVLVGRGVMTLDQLRHLLDTPMSDFPLSSQIGVEEFGLFLTDVEYEPRDLEFEPHNSFVATSPVDHTCSNQISDCHVKTWMPDRNVHKLNSTAIRHQNSDSVKPVKSTPSLRAFDYSPSSADPSSPPDECNIQSTLI